MGHFCSCLGGKKYTDGVSKNDLQYEQMWDIILLNLNRKYLITIKLSDVSQYVTIDQWINLNDFPFCLSHSHGSCTSLPTNLLKESLHRTRLLDGYWFDLIYYQWEINKQYTLISCSVISAQKIFSVSRTKDHVLWLLHKSLSL